MGFTTLRQAFKWEHFKKARLCPPPVSATDTVGDMEASSRRAFRDAFHATHYLLPFALTPNIVGRGFEHIYPVLSVPGLMSQWLGWSELSEKVASDFLACVPEIITAISGSLKPSWRALTWPPRVPDAKQQYQSPVNHGRAMLFKTSPCQHRAGAHNGRDRLTGPAGHF